MKRCVSVHTNKPIFKSLLLFLLQSPAHFSLSLGWGSAEGGRGGRRVRVGRRHSGRGGGSGARGAGARPDGHDSEVRGARARAAGSGGEGGLQRHGGRARRQTEGTTTAWSSHTRVGFHPEMSAKKYLFASDRLYYLLIKNYDYIQTAFILKPRALPQM